MESRNVLNRASELAAVLGKLGGASPGSEWNLQLAERFGAVKFPATKEEVLAGLIPPSEVRFRGFEVDLREAVTESRAREFRTVYELIECVKDALRRTGRREPAPAMDS